MCSCSSPVWCWVTSLDCREVGSLLDCSFLLGWSFQRSGVLVSEKKFLLRRVDKRRYAGLGPSGSVKVVWLVVTQRFAHSLCEIARRRGATHAIPLSATRHPCSACRDRPHHIHTSTIAARERLSSILCLAETEFLSRGENI